jgi:hypothetical protein
LDKKMLDVSVAYNRYRYLGNEFLTWLWFALDNDLENLEKIIPDEFRLSIGNRTVLENRTDSGVETVTIKGDDAGLEEGMLALKKGAVVTELNLSYETADKHWGFTLKGESLNISNLKLPDTGPLEAIENIEGTVLDKAYFYEAVNSLIDNLFHRFIRLRTSKDWHARALPSITRWITEKG